ncbi:MAG: ParA family protein [Alphaproteobacteria bacterium]|nr:ParA family protein [Alphaproteobacteria bacterium]
MKVIAVTSQKGGTGKTTISGHLAVQAERTGMGPVVMVDCDPQGSLTNWWNYRQVETPILVQTSMAKLEGDLESLRQSGVKLVIIDTPPAITWTIVNVIKLANLVVIPVRPSPHDLAATGSTVDLIGGLGKPLVFVLNSASPRARITTEAAVALSQHGAVAPSVIHHRTDFAASMIDGRTVMELPRTERSTREIECLWDYVAGQLERLSIVTPIDMQPTTAPTSYSDTPSDTSAEPIENQPLRAVGGNNG